MMLPKTAATTWSSLLVPTQASAQLFDEDTLAILPKPAQRFLRRVLPDGTPLTIAATLTMQGEIKLGKRWMAFEADQIIRAGVGFVWRPVIGGRILRFTGADILGPEDVRMEFRLHGLLPVARAAGPDVARSAAGRLAGETVAWLPQALTPQAGATWIAVDDNRAIANVDAAGESVDVEVTVDRDGALTSLSLQRWNDAAEPPQHQPFGGHIDAEYITAGGVRIAGAGSIGWHWDTPQWDDGEFFHYTVTDASPL